jgi:dual specificity protein kinase YAK1
VVYYICSGQPPDNLLRDAKNTTKFFKQVGRIYSNSVSTAYQVLTEEEYEAVSPHPILILTESLSNVCMQLQKGTNSVLSFMQRESKKPQIGKRYFKFITLEEIISHYPYRNNMGEDEILKGGFKKAALLLLLCNLFELFLGNTLSSD